MRNSTLSLALLATLTLFMAGCEKNKQTPPTPTVMVAEVIQKDVPVTQEWVGTLQGSVNAEIRPKVEGFLVKQLYLEGTGVRQGAPLFQIDPRTFQAAYDQAKGNLERDEAALNLADITVNRYIPLAKDNAVSQQELDQALSSQRQAQGNVQSAKAALEQARLNLAWCTVTSLISGIAGTALIQVGSLVNTSSVLTTVSTVDPIRAVYAISEQQYLRYIQAKKGQRERVDDGALQMILADGTTDPHRGKIVILNRQVDVKTGTITIVAEFPNPDGALRPGQYAKMRLVTYVKQGALLVPQVAVNELQGDFQVAVVGADGTVEMRSVTPAERVGTMWVVDKGLHPGEKVVVGGLQMVKSGMKVQTTAAPAPGSGPGGAEAPAGAKPSGKAPASPEGR